METFGEVLRKVVNIKVMNGNISKYQEAFENIIWNFKCVRTDAYKDLDDLKVSIDLLQELVDKETPMRMNDRYLRKCPRCNEDIAGGHDLDVENMNYCFMCGQRLDWRGENYE